MSGGYIADGSVQVSVIGGYIDERGDAVKNSLTLLKTLHEEERVLELIHFCVGSYNTAKAGNLKSEKSIQSTNKTFFFSGKDYRYGTPTMAILKGIAIDLEVK